MSYEDNIKKRHKERLKLGLIVLMLFVVFAFIDNYFNLGILR